MRNDPFDYTDPRTVAMDYERLRNKPRRQAMKKWIVLTAIFTAVWLALWVAHAKPKIPMPTGWHPVYCTLDGDWECIPMPTGWQPNPEHFDPSSVHEYQGTTVEIGNDGSVWIR